MQCANFAHYNDRCRRLHLRQSDLMLSIRMNIFFQTSILQLTAATYNGDDRKGVVADSLRD